MECVTYLSPECSMMMHMHWMNSEFSHFVFYLYTLSLTSSYIEELNKLGDNKVKQGFLLACNKVLKKFLNAHGCTYLPKLVETAVNYHCHWFIEN